MHDVKTMFLPCYYAFATATLILTIQKSSDVSLDLLDNFGSGGEARTRDLMVNSHPLYH